MSVLVLLQARLGSARLPGKVLLPLGGVPLVRWPQQRLATLGDVITCIPEGADDDPLAAAIEGPVHRGSEADVLGRFLGALALLPATELVVRATADNPFVLPLLAIEACATLQTEGADYCSIEGSALGSTVEMGPGTLAQLHLAATVPNLTLPSDLIGPGMYRADVLTRPLAYRQGKLDVPQSPGLGGSVDREQLRKLAS